MLMYACEYEVPSQLVTNKVHRKRLPLSSDRAKAVYEADMLRMLYGYRASVVEVYTKETRIIPVGRAWYNL